MSKVSLMVRGNPPKVPRPEIGKKYSCPICARYAAKMKDREGLAKAIHKNDHDYAESLDWWKEREESREAYRKLAAAVVRWMEE